MIFNLQNPHEHAKFKAYVNKLFEGRCVVEVKKKTPQRSTSQNRYLHLILGYFACEYGSSLDEVKVNFFKKICNKDLFEKERTNKQGKTVKYLISSSELNTSEMTLAIDRFRNYSASEAGIYLPAPNENQMLLFIEQEIEKNKEFI